jgi:predicted alpha/beta hydrolase family esterase
MRREGVAGGRLLANHYGRLRDAGHAAEAVNLPGRGGAVTVDSPACVDAAATAVGRVQPPVVLVTHSLGGITASAFLEASPRATARVVLVYALLVEIGAGP